MLQRAMRPQISYGRNILAETLRQAQSRAAAESYVILTQPEAWEAAQGQFPTVDGSRVICLSSLEHRQLMELEERLPESAIVLGIGGGQALDAAKYVSWRRGLPLLLAPTIVSADAALTNTIAVREGQRVQYIGFVVADAVAVDLAVISQAPQELNRSGIGDLLSIHTALWDWRHAGQNYSQQAAAQAAAILSEVYLRAADIAACNDAGLCFIVQSYARENTLCLQVGGSQPEEGSEHFLAYNLEFITGRGYIHGQLICLCVYAMARLQQNRPEWVLSLLERCGCSWRLPDLGIARTDFIQALTTLRAFAHSERYPPSVIDVYPITREFAERIASECDE
jgi:glycerol-1-phosphate dehydrogenase [NAD(P)+]